MKKMSLRAGGRTVRAKCTTAAVRRVEFVDLAGSGASLSAEGGTSQSSLQAGRQAPAGCPGARRLARVGVVERR